MRKQFISRCINAGARFYSTESKALLNLLQENPAPDTVNEDWRAWSCRVLFSGVFCGHVLQHELRTADSSQRRRWRASQTNSVSVRTLRSPEPQPKTMVRLLFGLRHCLALMHEDLTTSCGFNSSKYDNCAFVHQETKQTFVG